MASFSVAGPRRRFQVRQSPVHGRGVFATVALEAGDRLAEYRGESISWEEAVRRHPHDPSQPDHTFYFHINDLTVIDGGVGGNSTRWINHSCEPNLEAIQDGDRIWLVTVVPVEAGEELFFDYALMLNGRHTPKVKAQYACRCGAVRCRGTMLARKGRR